MTKEYLTREQKEKIQRQNELIRKAREEKNEERLKELQKGLKELKEAITPPSPIKIASDAVKEATGQDPVTLVAMPMLKKARQRYHLRHTIRDKIINS